MSEAERDGTEDEDRSERIEVRPTANPGRIRVPPEGMKRKRDEGVGKEPPSRPEEER